MFHIYVLIPARTVPNQKSRSLPLGGYRLLSFRRQPRLRPGGERDAQHGEFKQAMITTGVFGVLTILF